MKIMVTVGVYLSLIIVLGYVLVRLAPKERYNDDICDDEG